MHKMFSVRSFLRFLSKVIGHYMKYREMELVFTFIILNLSIFTLYSNQNIIHLLCFIYYSTRFLPNNKTPKNILLIVGNGI
jgi:hypothetical protein